MNTGFIEIPVLKPGSVIVPEALGRVLFWNGNRGVRVNVPRDDALSPEDGLPLVLDKLAGGDPGRREMLLKRLIGAGLVIEGDRRREYLPGEYVAYRLIDTFRDMAPKVWHGSALRARLATPGNRSLAIGFLLETYFHIRAANVTAAPVLGHLMSRGQRDLLERFFIDEKNHGKTLVGAFAGLGLDPEEVRYAMAAPETELLERFFHSCAHGSVAEFAAALIVPEVEEVPKGAGIRTVSFMDLIEEHQGIPRAVTRPFRAHHHENDELLHDALPVQLLAAEGFVTRERAETLLRSLYYAVEAYGLFLRGIERRYGENGAGSPMNRAPAHW